MRLGESLWHNVAESTGKVTAPLAGRVFLVSVEEPLVAWTITMMT